MYKSFTLDRGWVNYLGIDPAKGSDYTGYLLTMKSSDRVYVHVYDCWDAYKAYAAFLNWHRPRGHKLSWKRLNSQQRKQAMKWFDKMIDIGGVYRTYWERY